MYVCMYACIIYVCMYACMHIGMYACIYVCNVCICMYVCMYIYKNVMEHIMKTLSHYRLRQAIRAPGA